MYGTGHSEALLLDLLNSGHAVDGVERDALGDSALARAWMLERSISPTYSERMALIETRSTLLAVASWRAVTGRAVAASERDDLWWPGRSRRAGMAPAATRATMARRRSGRGGARHTGVERAAQIAPGSAACLLQRAMPTVRARLVSRSTGGQ